MRVLKNNNNNYIDFLRKCTITTLLHADILMIMINNMSIIY